MKISSILIFSMLMLVSCGPSVQASRSYQQTEVKEQGDSAMYEPSKQGQPGYLKSTPPKLVVGIVVDQMRYDYLTRFAHRYGEGGFNRLVRDGFNATNHHYNYVPTYTAPGHAAIYTGTTPANNGIIGNNWYDKFIEKTIYNASDPDVDPVGTDMNDGRMSPRKLLSTTVTDQLELHSQGRSKVIGISIKDRGAILPAGHAADAAYWFQGNDQGKFITSSYYMSELPEWVQNFNTSSQVRNYLKTWNTLYPLETYTASGKDLNDFERPPRGKDTATFPYDLSALAEKNGQLNLLKATPFGNSIVADFAIAALEAEKLGQGDETDFLAVSFSSTDYIGHQYGVNSVELEDTYLRLDQDLERLFKALDQQVGQGNYTVFLTADHGAVNVPAYLQSKRIEAGYFDGGQFEEKLNQALSDTYNTENLIKNISNDQIFFNHQEMLDAGVNASDLQQFVAQTIINFEHIDKVFTRDALVSGSFTEGTGRLIQNGFHHKRSGDVVYVLEPGVISYPTTGSTHGSSQSYDTHVPLLFYGKGIKPGQSARRYEITDIAPTISSLLQIAFPNASIGNPIVEVLED
ncbi:alkaline phosphatase PafA [Nonlabens xiamenensis]|uniref:alkaline phosphatase PafA n=1 Tax=Nonlabens xiamenensis TaxID=2341043 RepID=UPI000F612419|nr:alkaline phosphatase PafA [Nonlabens xiamenensis]